MQNKRLNLGKNLNYSALFKYCHLCNILYSNFLIVIQMEKTMKGKYEKTG